MSPGFSANGLAEAKLRASEARLQAAVDLVGDALVGRFDLKADRQAGALLVQAAWAEPERATAEVGHRAVEELQRMAAWLGLGEVVVRDRGNLPLPLAG